MQYFIGIDIGTSSTRAVLFTGEGVNIFSAGYEYSPEPGPAKYHEFNAESVFEKTLRSVRDLMDGSGIDKKKVAGIGLSCYMHSLMAVNASGLPLTGVMTWADNRAAQEASEIAARGDGAALYRKTGCLTHHSMYPLSKIVWLRKYRNDVFNSAFKFITFKEFLLYRLYGEFAVDLTLASCQGCFNINSQTWDEDILRDILQVGKERFSQPVECTQVFTGMDRRFADAMGLDPDTPVTIGAGDGIMSNLGSGVFDDSSLSCTLGTSGAIRTTVDKPMLDDKQRLWCYSFLKDRWVSGGAINNGGIVLKWLRDRFSPLYEDDALKQGKRVYEIMDERAGRVPCSSEGLIFLPYLTGERAPDWNAGVRGLMYGLSYHHGPDHMLRAAMEGVMYRLYSVYAVMREINPSAKTILASGGYVKSRLWVQMQADIFGKDLLVPRCGETSAAGAAYLSMVNAGVVRFGERTAFMQPVLSVSPSEENHAIYARAFEQAMQFYGSVYPN